MKRYLTTSLLLMLLLCAISVQAQSPNGFNPSVPTYRWPTEASSHLTSTFGETRSAHFHAALDIKTWGRRGYEVYATRDGVVDRIAIGPRGYGKVVYLKHEDGSYSVYAHLLSFNRELQELADSLRFSQNYQFEMERFLSWKNIRVQQGEVIGYSGASGIGPPHLHFELRTPNHKPFNPLLTNLDVTDTVPPRITGLAVEPLSPRSSIEGKNAIHIRNIRKGSSANDDPIEVSGPVGLAVEAFDQSNGVTNAYAVYELSMEVNGERLFHSRVDSFSYGETDQMFLDRIYPLLQREKGSFQRLHVVDGNTLPFYSTGPQQGVLDLAPGQHRITIRARDFFGNTTSITQTLDVSKRNSGMGNFRPGTVSREIGTFTSPHDWSWFPNWLTISESTFERLTLALPALGRFTSHQNGISIDLQGQENLFVNIPTMGPVVFRRITPHTEHLLATADQRDFAIFPENTVYDTVSVGMAVDRPAADSISVEMVPEAYPLRGAYTFRVERDSALVDTAKRSFYKWDRFDDDEQWELIPTSFSGQYIRGSAESLGTFVLRRDTTSPTLSNPRLRQRPDKQWVLMIDAVDNLSGIDYERSAITVNGIRGIAEFEPEDDRLVYYHPRFEPADSMKVEVTACDKMDNCRSSVFDLISE